MGKLSGFEVLFSNTGSGTEREIIADTIGFGAVSKNRTSLIISDFVERFLW
jgi:hypothetical protein